MMFFGVFFIIILTLLSRKISLVYHVIVFIDMF